MRFYQQPHAFYCRVDLHARTLYSCVFNQAGDKLLHQEIPSEPAALQASRRMRHEPTPAPTVELTA